MNHDHLSERDSTKVEAEPMPNLVEKYKLFKEHMHPKADVVYHPCGANDVSPSEVFPESRVIYADLDENAMRALNEKGYEAHTVDVLEYDPGDVDVLILLNPAISPEVPSSYVTPGGFVVCNDYHRTADWLHNKDEYELKAIVRDTKEGLVFDDIHPEDYWKEVETEEEFQKASGSMGAANYTRASQIVEEMTGKRENILENYKAIVQRAQEEDLASRRELSSQGPDREVLALFGGEPTDTIESLDAPEPELDTEGPWHITNPNGGMIILQALPRKLGREEDIFVFQKRAVTEREAA